MDFYDTLFLKNNLFPINPNAISVEKIDIIKPKRKSKGSNKN